MEKCYNYKTVYDAENHVLTYILIVYNESGIRSRYMFKTLYDEILYIDNLVYTKHYKINVNISVD